MTIFLTDGLDRHADRLAALGPHTTGVGCLYVRKLADVDPDVLRELLSTSLASAKQQVASATEP